MSNGPLSGVSVLELGGLGPGAFAGMLLADLGAEVVRIDRAAPATGGIDAIDPRFDVLNRGKRSLALDLKKPAAVELFLTMAARADVVTESYRPGVAERLGVGPDTCLQRNPRLVYGRMTGWGQDGPLAHTAGHDINYIALTGALHAIGERGGPPQIPVNLVGDLGGGGTFLVIGVLAALNEVARGGAGQVVDAAIVDGAGYLMGCIHGLLAGGQWRDERGVNILDGGAPFYAVYETADGGHMAVGAGENKFYAQLLDRLGLPDDPGGQYAAAGWPSVRERMESVFRTRSRDEWTEVFEGSDCCVTPVLGIVEAAEHPHNRHRGNFLHRDGVLQPAPAPRFSRTVADAGDPPPSPGQHSRDVLTDWGLPDVERLLAERIATQQ